MPNGRRAGVVAATEVVERASGTADSRRVRSNQRSNSVIVACTILGAVQLDGGGVWLVLVFERLSIERERDQASCASG